MEEQGVHFVDSQEDVNQEQIDITKENSNISDILNNKTKLLDLNDFSVQAINSYVVILPYKENPYKELQKTESGLILGFDNNRYRKNPDSGEIEESEEVIKFGKIISVGQDCKRVKEGDDVAYNARVEVPIPFGKKGYYTTSEQNIFCIIKRNNG